MFESKAQSICNALGTIKGSVPMTRSLGLTDVDDNRPTIRKDAVVQLRTFYPDVDLSAMSMTATADGHFTINMSLRGEA